VDTGEWLHGLGALGDIADDAAAGPAGDLLLDGAF